MSLVPRGLRYKLLISFCLMSIIPLLVALYLMRDYVFNVFMAILSPNYAFPPMLSTSWILFFCLAIAVLGLVLAKRIIEPVIEMALQTKLIAEGNFGHELAVGSDDEVGDLAHSINKLTARIRENMDELKSYGEKTELINLEIHRRVMALSSLLQIGENISAGAQMEDVMTIIIEKVAQLMDSGYSILLLPKANEPQTLEVNITTEISNEKLRQLELKFGIGVLGKALEAGTVIHADSATRSSGDVQAFRELYDIKNFAAFPIISHNKSVGLLLVGNEIPDFVFKEDDLDVISVFIRQAAIAYESDVLAKKSKELAIKDDLTNLYNQQYIATRLDEEIKRAIIYQRPCSYIVFNIDNFNKFRDENGELVTERALKKVAFVLQENVTQIGRAARLSGDEFALLLPEKNKKEAYRIAEEVRGKVEKIDLELKGKKGYLTVSGGVSENPLDGSTAEELIKKATTSVSKAKSNGKNKIA